MVASENTGLKINDNVELFDKNYRGWDRSIERFRNKFILPYQTKQKIYSLEITNKSLRTKRARKQYVEAMEDIFETKVEANEERSIDQITGNIMFLLMVAIILSAFLVCVLGYKYINDKRKDNYRVYNI